MFFTRILSLCIAIKEYVLYCIAPPICAYCNTFIHTYSVLCNPCMQDIKPLVSVMLPVTKKYSVPILAVGEYADPLKKMILAKGWSDIIASYELGELVADYVIKTGICFDYIVPVPLHWSRYAYRGYNQSENIASVIARRMHIPKVMLVRRVRATPQQSSVISEQREKNVASAFQLMNGDLSVYRNKRILIVDDVMTTGATMKAVVKTIKQLVPHSITGIVAARVN